MKSLNILSKKKKKRSAWDVFLFLWYGCWFSMVSTNVSYLHINMNLCMKPKLTTLWLNNKNQMFFVDKLQLFVKSKWRWNTVLD